MNHLFATYQKNTANDAGTRFAARPIREWRKQYQTSLGYSRAATGMPMDRPGGLVPVASPAIQCATCRGALPARVDVFKGTACTSCQPIKSQVKPLVIPSLNRYSLDPGSETAFTDNAAYLQSRCTTYVQKLSTAQVPSITYFSPTGLPLEPSMAVDGPQVRETANCYTPLASVCERTIYKPNNTQFAQQGGVTSSSRMARLKYNTLNQNGAEYQSAIGAMGVNSGRYQTEPSPSYYNKYKPQAVVFPHKTGSRTYCNEANTTC